MGQGGISLNRSENAVPFDTGFTYPENSESALERRSREIRGQGTNRADFVRALGLTAGNNKSTSFAATTQVPASDPWESTQVQQRVPQTQEQPPQTPPPSERSSGRRRPGGALAQSMRPNNERFGARINNNKRALIGGLSAFGAGSAITIDSLIQNEQERRQPQGQY